MRHGATTEVRRAAARSPLTMTRQATSHATSRAAGAATHGQATTRPTARPMTTALTSRTRPSTRRRRRAARWAAARRTASGVAGSAASAAVCRRRTAGRGLGRDGRHRRGASGGHDQAGLAATDRLAAGQHAHGVREALDGAAAHRLVMVLERLGDEVDGPGHRQGDEDQCARVHTPEVRFASTAWGGCLQVCRETTGVTRGKTPQESRASSDPGHSSTVIAKIRWSRQSPSMCRKSGA